MPLRDLTLALRGRPADTSTLDLPSFEATLGNRDAEAGHISGSGRWTRTRWNLDMLLAEVQPALLDARAPAMRVAGPLKIAGSDLAAADSLAIDLASQLDGRWTGPGPKRGRAACARCEDHAARDRSAPGPRQLGQHARRTLRRPAAQRSQRAPGS